MTVAVLTHARRRFDLSCRRLGFDRINYFVSVLDCRRFNVSPL